MSVRTTAGEPPGVGPSRLPPTPRLQLGRGSGMHVALSGKTPNVTLLGRRTIFPNQPRLDNRFPNAAPPLKPVDGRQIWQTWHIRRQLIAFHQTKIISRFSQLAIRRYRPQAKRTWLQYRISRQGLAVALGESANARIVANFGFGLGFVLGDRGESRTAFGCSREMLAESRFARGPFRRRFNDVAEPTVSQRDPPECLLEARFFKLLKGGTSRSKEAAANPRSSAESHR
jgi:hypothetical protein